MQMLPRLARRLAVFVMLISTIGCGEKFYKVQGKVTFEGKPMQGGGSISFVPMSGERQRAAGGEITEDGSYALTTEHPGDGASVGEFRVVITQVTEKEGRNVGDGARPGARGGLSLPLADRIPVIYADHQNSPLTGKVEAKTPNEINFDLLKKK